MVAQFKQLLHQCPKLKHCNEVNMVVVVSLLLQWDLLKLITLNQTFLTNSSWNVVEMSH